MICQLEWYENLALAYPIPHILGNDDFKKLNFILAWHFQMDGKTKNDFATFDVAAKFERFYIKII